MFELSHRPMDKRSAKYGHFGLKDSSLGAINYKIDSSPQAEEIRAIKKAAREAREKRAIRKGLREMEDANNLLAQQKNLKPNS